MGRRALMAAAVATLGFGTPALADGHQVVDSIHFLIPGGAGDGKAIAFLIENADSNQGTLMVNFTPIVIRSLTGVFPQSFRDLTLVMPECPQPQMP